MNKNRHSDAIFQRHFDGTESDDNRRVDASLIQQAGESGLQISLRKAIVQGCLEFRSNTFGTDVCFAECVFTNRVRFPYCRFNANLDLSRSIFQKECDFRAATIAGELRLTGARFSGPVVRFEDAHVQGVVWADRTYFESRARFRRVRFDRSAFFRRSIFKGDASFEETQFSGEAAFNGARFSQAAKFSSVRIAGQAGFIGVTFEKHASFNAARIENHALFSLGSGDKASGTRFEGSADFTATQIDLTADFRGAHFKKRADFNCMRVGGDAYFWSEMRTDNPVLTIFEQEADFTGVRVGGDADFGGAIFGMAFVDPSLVAQKDVDPGASISDETVHAIQQHEARDVSKLTSFNGATFVGHARFSSVAPSDEKQKPLVTAFGLDADFTSATIGGLALFEGVRFQRKAYFNFAQVKGNARFCSLSQKISLDTMFCDEASFTGLKIFGNANFKGVRFFDKANFKGMGVGGIANFECNNFNGATAFDHARFSQDVHFEGTVFRCPSSFREASFRVVNFSPNGRVGDQDQFQGPLDLSGWVYDRIEVDWQRLLARPDHSPRFEFDLQPYNQLERIFRSVGKDREADKVYLERCRVERREKWNRGKSVRRLGWAANAVYGMIANYGVRPIRLAIYSLVLVLFGSIVFWQEGAVKPSKEESAQVFQSVAPTSAKANKAAQPARLNFWGALAVSIHQFLPVDIPSGADWKPSGALIMRFIPSHLYASILKIAGWIFVPLGVAAVTGVLRRVVR